MYVINYTSLLHDTIYSNALTLYRAPYRRKITSRARVSIATVLIASINEWRRRFDYLAIICQIIFLIVNIIYDVVCIPKQWLDHIIIKYYIHYARLIIN